MQLSPDFLLAHPEMVTASAPWCVVLDNLELGTLLLAQPWLAGDGLRRADLERQLTGLAAELPLGPIYFQRVNRAVARLEAIGAVAGVGSGHSRRFLATPPGFGALLLNLRVLRRDPTLDGSEFELKRALAAMWNLVLERLARLPDQGALPPDAERFLEDVDRLTVLGQRVVTEQVVDEALDVLRLVAIQREHVIRRLDEARERLRLAEVRAGALRDVDPARLGSGTASGTADPPVGAPGALATVVALATSVLPQLSLRATVLRYERYRHYLDGLTTLYAAELKTVDLGVVRGMLARRRA
jgi:hypothetical protein